MQLPTYAEACKKILFKETRNYYLYDTDTLDLYPNPLDEFIYNEEILSQSPNNEFRKGLVSVITYIKDQTERKYLLERELYAEDIAKLQTTNKRLKIVMPILALIGIIIGSLTSPYLP